MDGKNPFIHVMKVTCVEPGVETSQCYFIIAAANTNAAQLHGIISAETLDALGVDHNLYIEISAPRTKP